LEIRLRLRLLRALTVLLWEDKAEDYDYGPVFERLEKRLPELIRQANRRREEAAEFPPDLRKSKSRPHGISLVSAD
jgi:hypothetical protein